MKHIFYLIFIMLIGFNSLKGQTVKIDTTNIYYQALKRYISKVANSASDNKIADYKWTRLYNGNQYTLTLVRGEDIWFKGLLIVNHLDTFRIGGFVKGGTYPSWYVSTSDSTKKGDMMLEYYNDSIQFEDWGKKIFDTDIFFYKVK